MDNKLPGIDGFEVTRRIREEDTRVPIIAQTAYAFDLDKDKALAAGCNALITKPITSRALKEVIEAMLVRS